MAAAALLTAPLNIAKRRGSISAEHGLGFKKANFIHYSKSEGAISLMKQLKTLFDPNVSLIAQSFYFKFFNLFRAF